jgi:hypothetical protein
MQMFHLNNVLHKVNLNVLDQYYPYEDLYYVFQIYVDINYDVNMNKMNIVDKKIYE